LSFSTAKWSIFLINAYQRLPSLVKTFNSNFLFNSSNFQYDKLNENIWKFPFYLLPVQDQKDFRFFMQHAMVPYDMKLFFIGDLNLNLFIKVYILKISAFICKDLVSMNFEYCFIVLDNENGLLLFHGFARNYEWLRSILKRIK
jgi:hypothetical protein